MPPLSVLMKPASGLCNMRCDYCFYCDEAEKRSRESYGFMTEETLRNIIRRILFRAEGAASFAYQGGEPTLRGLPFFRKAAELQKHYNKTGLRIENVLQTNGTLLNEEWCEFLRDNHFLVGLSIDGTKAVHDSFRHFKDSGESPFAAAEKAAALMDLYGVEYNILTVVNSETAAHIEEIYAFYKEKGWKWQQYIACLDPLDEEGGLNPWSLTPALYGDFLIKLFDLWQEDVLKGTQPYIRQFENYAGMLLSHAPEACEMRGKCGIQYVAEADGSVYPCDFYMLDEYLLGNFNKDRVEQIDMRREEIGFIKRSENLSGECFSCPYYQLCRGGCQRCRVPGPEGAYKNYFCPAYKRFFETCLPRLKEIMGI